MLLARLQHELQILYEIDTGYRVQDFVIHDSQLASLLDQSANPRAIPEKLLLCEEEGDLHLSLYLDAGIVDRLPQSDLAGLLNEDYIVDFWTVLEGVSHFLYVIHRAQFDHEFSLLELELQAEIDKFVLANHFLPEPQQPLLWGLYHRLYSEWTLDQQLEANEVSRYRQANALAARYARHITERLLAGWDKRNILNGLRRFYRLSHHQKIRAIDALPVH